MTKHEYHRHLAKSADAVDREINRYKGILIRLRDAIARYESGKYGICERCGKPIHPDRLAVLPDTTLCIDCAQKGR